MQPRQRQPPQAYDTARCIKKIQWGHINSQSGVLIGCCIPPSERLMHLRCRAFLTKLDIHGDTHPGVWERINRLVDRLTPRKNERNNEADAASG